MAVVGYVLLAYFSSVRMLCRCFRIVHSNTPFEGALSSLFPSFALSSFLGSYRVFRNSASHLPSTTPVSVFRSIAGHDSFPSFRFQEEFHISVGPVWCWGRQRSNRLRTSGSRPSPWLSSLPFHCRALTQTKKQDEKTLTLSSAHRVYGNHVSVWKLTLSLSPKNKTKENNNNKEWSPQVLVLDKALPVSVIF